MREALLAMAAGSLCAGAVLAAGFKPGLDLSRLSVRVAMPYKLDDRAAGLLRALSRGLERAGRKESPHRAAALAFGFAASAAVVAGALTPALVVPAFAGVCATAVLMLHSAIEQRRRRLLGELVPILELFTLELSGGGSAMAALGSVSVQVDSELARDLRVMLIASQVTGAMSFEARLLEYSERLNLPAAGTLATILAASRDYGTATSQGVRALATDLRRAQRRELIAQSRRALNNVLFPAAVAVLLPFLGILMYPAVSVLQSSLR